MLNPPLHPKLGAVASMMLELLTLARITEELAERAYVPRVSFAQLFREVSNSTPLAASATLRLQFTTQTLSRGLQSLVVVAESVDYTSKSSSRKVFLRGFGCAPGEHCKRVKALKV